MAAASRLAGHRAWRAGLSSARWWEAWHGEAVSCLPSLICLRRFSTQLFFFVVVFLTSHSGNQK